MKLLRYQPAARSCHGLPWLAILAGIILAPVGRGDAALSATGPAAGPPADKSQYHLFRPTPSALLREMSTDRPDKTESAYTVDAGHFQAEMDLVTFTSDHDRSNGGDVRVNSFAVAPVNLKVGLLDDLDLQLVLETWNWVKTEDRTSRTTIHQSGFGDIIPRLKFNLWGNNGGRTALALMPFVKVPTHQDELGNRYVEGGLIVPFAADLPKGWSLGLMTQFNVMRDLEGGGYHPDFVNSITFGHDILGKLGGYAEFFSEVSTEAGSPWIGTVDLGLTYAITPNLQLDAGINIGITRSADDINPFLGLSFRY
jgi:hypothetical protein